MLVGLLHWLAYVLTGLGVPLHLALNWALASADGDSKNTLTVGSEVTDFAPQQLLTVLDGT